MSVIVTLLINGDPKKLEEFAGANQDVMHGIVDVAKENGLVAHRFYGSDDGRILVIDEWPDEQSFQSFFAAAGDRIRPMMQEVGATSEPEIGFWHKLEAHDEVGWGS